MLTLDGKKKIHLSKKKLVCLWVDGSGKYTYS